MIDEKARTTTPPTYSYSLDGELFEGEFDSPEAAAEAAFDGDQSINDVSVGEVREVTAHRYVSADRILGDVTDRAYDDIGVASDDWLCEVMGSQDRKAELAKLVGDWLQAQEPPTFGRITRVRHITRLKTDGN